ncbi:MULTISPECIES: CoA transferase [Nitrosomonas]|uniref:Carnitine dehydratase n=1 Tax=Nitrosomonas communis TaxID=44574 RepID=A0A0F7KE64_9PROT|nr:MULTISPECIES: CoA transferase [Nitrosomonas]AKH37109.1 carnitine dehydratase [Nitrosomonas communis]TYP94572.1 crotonobetainyl-CoA:carnitine CoA-transferase CaiB-like acyl-CoA transferase [Nitrosomonas communis]UVS62277.1 CoA transferase [Nitrosomonas sp. PLL12]
MNRPLTNCTISGFPETVLPDFSAVASSIRYQSKTLGIKVESQQDSEDKSAASFQFQTLHTTPVTCDITRWNDNKPAAVTENIMQARCGLMSVHGRASGKPQSLGINYISTLTATLALQGVIAASIGQLRGAQISNINVSMASSALMSMGQYIAGATTSDAPEKLFPDLIGSEIHPPFKSKDGIVFELETLNAEIWKKFWTEAGVSLPLVSNGWKSFWQRYAKAVSPLPEELSRTLSNLTYQQISQICVRTGMAICPVRSIDDRADDIDSRHVWHQGPWEFLFHSRFDSAFSNRATNHLPLSGLTIIESCRRIQGPLAGHLLSLLGANVIRIEPPGGDPLRGMPPIANGCSARFDALNHLKDVREIDIKSTSGQKEIKELIRHADVFLHNWMPGKAVLLNLDYDDLASINPSLIYAYAGGWSTDSAEHVSSNTMPGTDFMAQAYSGIAHKIAKASGSQGGSLFTVLDVLGGVIAAQGVCIALLNRCINNVGAKVTSSLMSAATLLCVEDFQNLYEQPNVKSSKKSIINAVFPTKHEKIAIECHSLDAARKLAVILNITTDPGTIDFHQQLSNLFLAKTAQEWVEFFEQEDIPAGVVIEDLSKLQTIPYLQRDLCSGSYTKINSPWSFQ